MPGQSIAAGFGMGAHIPPSTPPGPPGPPFALNSADNGLSVDVVTGEIVWGNNIGTGIGGSAALLNDREIDTQGFSMLLRDFAAQNETRYAANSVRVFDQTGTLQDCTLDWTGLAVVDNLNSRLGNYNTNNFSIVDQVSGDFINGHTNLLTVQNAAGDRTTISATQLLVLDAVTNSQSELLSTQLTIFDGVANDNALVNGSTFSLQPGAGGSVFMRATSATSLLDFSDDGSTTTIQMDVTIGSVTATGDGLPSGFHAVSNNTLSYANISLQNDIGTMAQLVQTGSAFAGAFGADTVGFYGPGAGGIVLFTIAGAGMRVKSDNTVNLSNVQNFATNALALAGGLVIGDVYRTAGVLMIVI